LPPYPGIQFIPQQSCTRTTAQPGAGMDSYLFDFDALDALVENVEAREKAGDPGSLPPSHFAKEAEDSEDRRDSSSAERSTEDTDDGDSEDSLSEVWPGEIVGELSSECSDTTEVGAEDVERIGCLEVRNGQEEVPLWEVVFTRVVVRSQPSLDAQVAGICSQKEIVAEDPDAANPDWVRLVDGSGYILKDGRRKDPNLGVLIHPFQLRNVPPANRIQVAAYLRDAWTEAREKSNFLKPPLIKSLRKAADDAIEAAGRAASRFDVDSFADSFVTEVRLILAAEEESSARKANPFATATPAAAVPAAAAASLAPGAPLGASGGTLPAWKHCPPTVKGPDSHITLDDVMLLMTRMKQRMLPATDDVVAIISKASRLFAEEESLVKLRVPYFSTLHIVGDIHGQYWDLLHIIEVFGVPGHDNMYLFNGDFVDRGRFSVEVAIALLALKVAAPCHVHLNRGNHESIRMNAIYGFMAEVKQKYQEEMFTLFCEAFRCLPLATVVNSSVFVVHGGLGSVGSVCLDRIARLNRKQEPDETADTLMLELLWSDPTESPGTRKSPRGGGVLFGPDITKHFCAENSLICVVRSHEMKMEGFEWHHDKMCLTVFSAPNYCGICGNLGAVCDISPRNGDAKLMMSDLQVRTFEATDHPQESAPPMMGVF